LAITAREARAIAAGDTSGAVSIDVGVIGSVHVVVVDAQPCHIEMNYALNRHSYD
jgi:hypothetical protein